MASGGKFVSKERLRSTNDEAMRFAKDDAMGSTMDETREEMRVKKLTSVAQQAGD